MQIENRFHIQLDYKGYMIEPKTARVLPAPLMGSKFSTGRTSYSDFDFWQSDAMTNFSRGINQKFLSDTNAYWFSNGIDVSYPGEFKLEKDIVTETSSVLTSAHGQVTATYRSSDRIYVGTSKGYVFYRLTNASEWVLISSITHDDHPVTCFFEVVDSNAADYQKVLYVCKGDYKGWILIDGTWEQVGPIIQWAPSLSRVEGVPVAVSGLLHNRKIAQSIILNSSEKARRISVLYKTVGGFNGRVILRFHYSDMTTGGIAPSSIIKEYQITLPTATDWTWYHYNITNDDDRVVLSRCDKYFLEIEALDGNDTVYPEFACSVGRDSTYDGDVLIEMENGATEYSFAARGQQLAFKIWSDLPDKVYYVSSQGHYAFGYVDNGIKTTSNGVLWSPDSTRGLWTLPAQQGRPLAMGRTAGGTIIGGESSLWKYVGSTSAMSLWDFPDYINANNFKGFCEWNNKIIFSVENQGIYMTDGTGTIHTNMQADREAFQFESCAGITTCGWQAFALVKRKNDSEWYLAKSTALYDQFFTYWWIVKGFGNKIPVGIISLNINDVIIFHSDGTIQKYSYSGPYQDSGYIETSLIDAGLVKLDKLYKNIEAIFEEFEEGTKCKLSIRNSLEGTYIDSNEFDGGSTESALFRLPNPTSGNRLQIKTTIYSNSINTRTPVCTDIVWTYILQRSINERNVLKSVNMSIICENSLEDNLGDVEFETDPDARTRAGLVKDLWDTVEKRETLNYIGFENVSTPAFHISYAGTHIYTIKIDRTNYLFSIYEGSTLKYSYNYQGATAANLIAELNEKIITGDTEKLYCTLVDPITETDSIEGLEPVIDYYIKQDTYLNLGTDVKAVIITNSSPNQIKMALDGRGSDRVMLSLREAD